VRRAGVSSFGIGGTNAHAVLEEAPVAAASSESRAWQLLVVSARTRTALDTATAQLAAYLNGEPAALADVAYTLNVGRRVFAHRRVVVSRDAAGAAQALAQDDRGGSNAVEADDRSCVFMFSGQGAQYVAWLPGCATANRRSVPMLTAVAGASARTSAGTSATC
jgi:acyl transferase domain-containing protein